MPPQTTYNNPETGNAYGHSKVEGEGEADPEMAEMLKSGRFKGTKPAGAGAADAAARARAAREKPGATPSPSPSPKPLATKPKREDFPAGIVGQSKFNDAKRLWNEGHPTDKVSSLGEMQRRALA